MLLRAAPSGDIAHPVRIQRACGCAECAAKQKLGIQPGLAIGPANDSYEREADRVAEQVAAGHPAAPVARLQRQGEDEEEETAQLKRTASGRSMASGASAAAAAVASGGRPLGSAERAFFEPRFGRDLSHVRLHADAAAARAAAGISARAYTLRNHIAFAPGQYATGTTEGRRLMAHELTHTLQQGYGPIIRRLPVGLGLDEDPLGRPDDPFGRRSRQMEDPRGPGASTLTFAQSRELSRCISVMGDTDVARAECANMVLGTPIPEWKQVAGISSPVPFRAEVSAAGAATHRIGPVNLTILPDATSADPAMQDRAETTIRFPPLASGTNLVDWVSQNGRITSFTFNQNLFSLTIQTTFGPGVSAASISGYGRGTTAADQEVGATSLGFHEGEHGRDFITFLQDNPYPSFTGRVGQTTAVFSARVTQFSNAVNAYIARMNRASALATDCPGTSIDNFNAAKGTATTICVHRPGD
jgi:Domain of unknown function (DUF4157)